MEDIRRRIARIIEAHLDEVLDRTMAAYVAEIPSLAQATEQALRRVRESTRRATLAFLALFADPESPARSLLDDARRATIDRAGEIYDRDEILAMFRIGRHVVYQSARELVRAELEIDRRTDAEVATALEAFLDEMQRTEELVPRRDEALHRLLASAESEGPDLA